MNSAIDWSQEATAVEAIPEKALADIAAIAQQLRKAQSDAEKAESALKAAEALVRKIETVDLPDAMASIGMEKFTLSSGETVTVKAIVSAAITEAHQHECLEWLRSTGNDSLIKHTLTLTFGKGEDAVAQQVVEAIQEVAADVQLSVKDSVHAQTLAAFVRERLALEAATVPPLPTEERFPKALFSVFEGKKAAVTKPKK